MKHAITWHTAQPLWPRILAAGDTGSGRFRAPALLRFKGDDFMHQLQTTLAHAPDDLHRFVAQSESWREEKAGLRTANTAAGEQPIKLFHPAHYRFYLVAAALVCQVPGLPERRVRSADGDSTAFVMRRLVPRSGIVFDPADESTYDEYGWAGTQQSGQWRPLADRTGVADYEERLALFPAAFTFEHQARRLLAGAIPVARRDVYEAAVAVTLPAASTALLQADPLSYRAAALATEHVIPGFALLADPEGLKPPEAASPDAEQPLRLQAKIAFVHALLELAEFIAAEIGPVWAAMQRHGNAGLAGAKRTLYDALDGYAPGSTRRWREILVEAGGDSVRTRAEAGTVDEAFADALLGVSLSRPSLRSLALGLIDGGGLQARLLAALPDPRLESYSRSAGSMLDALAQPGASDAEAQDTLLMALLALAEFLSTELPDLWKALATESPSFLGTADRAVYDLLATHAIGLADWRTLLADTDAHRAEILAGNITPRIRVVGQQLTAAQIAAAATLASQIASALEVALASHPLPAPSDARAGAVAASASEPPAAGHYRIRCVYENPRCRGVHDAVVSDPSAPFQLASFFDAEAPVRPIRIQMPDVGLKSLRRAPRGVAIAVSKELREQIERVRKAGLKDLADGKLGDAPAFDFGLVCSLSIPIITICALILLMIIVQLLNIVFWWVPYFILCLPRLGKGS